MRQGLMRHRGAGLLALSGLGLAACAPLLPSVLPASEGGPQALAARPGPAGWAQAGQGLLGPWRALLPRSPRSSAAEPAGPEALQELLARRQPWSAPAKGEAPEAELAPWGQSLQGVRLLGLGEATHGTSGLVKLKARLAAHAAKRLGFQAVAIEGGSALAEALNRHVAGQGGLSEALAAEPLGWWNTEEVWAFANWARQEAKASGLRLRFASADFQSPQAEMKAIVGALGPTEAAEARQAFSGVAWEALLWESFGQLPEAERAARVAAIRRVHERLSVGLSPLLRHQAWVVWQAAELRRQISEPSTALAGFARRDALMAEQLRWLLEQPGHGKLIYWAHNSHVGRFHDYAAIPGFDSTGLRLTQALGPAYHALGSSFDRGEVLAQPQFGTPYRAIGVGEALPASVDALLKQAGPCHWLPLKGLPANGPLGRWLGQERPMRNVGYVVAPGTPIEQLHHPVVASEAFDGLVHLGLSEAAHAR